LAAAIIPILSSAIPLLRPYIISLVTHVEHLFGPKTGPTKFDAVLKALLDAASKLSTAGKLPGTLDPGSAGSMIESIVQELKALGILNPAGVAPIVQAGSVLPPASGSMLKIVGGTLQIG